MSYFFFFYTQLLPSLDARMREVTLFTEPLMSNPGCSINSRVFWTSLFLIADKTYLCIMLLIESSFQREYMLCGLKNYKEPFVTE